LGSIGVPMAAFLICEPKSEKRPKRCGRSS
jgi:hypothetical protein